MIAELVMLFNINIYSRSIKFLAFGINNSLAVIPRTLQNSGGKVDANFPNVINNQDEIKSRILRYTDVKKKKNILYLSSVSDVTRPGQ